MPFSEDFLKEAATIITGLNTEAIEKAALLLAETRAIGGRLFILGVGGSAASASHAVNDFRKLCAFEAYAPTDNVSELTARTNDEGWDTVFAAWLVGSKLAERDALFILSVGGGSREKNVSANLVKAIDYAAGIGSRIIGIVGRDGGYTATHADACIVIPTVNPSHITPHTEAFHGVVWHLLVSHPVLKVNATKWEGESA